MQKRQGTDLPVPMLLIGTRATSESQFFVAARREATSWLDSSRSNYLGLCISAHEVCFVRLLPTAMYWPTKLERH